MSHRVDLTTKGDAVPDRWHPLRSSLFNKRIYAYLAAKVKKMPAPATIEFSQQKKLYSIVLALSVFTILYNLIEGLLATWFGYQDESVALFGFGIDSFIELISGLGIAHMIIRLQSDPAANRDKFERMALRITGVAFYMLVVGLVVTAGYNLYVGHAPETTFWGVVISVISIMVMMALIYGKTKTGKALNSEAILADAQCTRVCIYMSITLLISSAIFTVTGFRYMDALGALVLAWFSFREGKECFHKASSDSFCHCDHH